MGLLMLIVSACNSTETEQVTDASVLTNTEIEAAYQRAVEAFIWFDLTPMPRDWENQIKDEYGNMFARVIHDEINTLAHLEAHLRSIFTPELVSEILYMNYPYLFYRDFDGVLYVRDVDRGSSLTKGDETHEIIRVSDEKIIYRVAVDIFDRDTLDEVIDTEVHDFAYVLVDGRWLFSNFNLVR